MSFSYTETTRRQRRLPSIDSRRSALGYWLPLGVTVTAAALGLAAWAWKEHRDSSEDEYLDYSDNAEYARRLEKERRDLRQAGPGTAGPPGSFPGDVSGRYGSLVEGQESEIRRAEFDEQGIAIEDVEARASEEVEGEGFVAQMRGAIKRTPSPQKLYEGARDRVAQGWQAVGKGLAGIREEGDEFGDHERWSEEADSKEEKQSGAAFGSGVLATEAAATAADTAAIVRSSDSATTVRHTAALSQTQPQSRGRKRTIAIVVSAESSLASTESYDQSTYSPAHASILSHLTGHTIPSSVELLILIYAPTLSSHPLSTSNTNQRKLRASSDDSYSNLPTPNTNTANEDDDPSAAESAIISSYTAALDSEPSNLYTALTTQAASLVAHSTHILPFTTPTGHVHLLKHLAPNLVYMQEELCGERGSLLGQVDGWVGQVIILIGAAGGGLVDTETEDEGRLSDGEGRKGRRTGENWWTNDPRIGFGKGIEIVEGVRVGDDWEKRVGGQ